MNDDRCKVVLTFTSNVTEVLRESDGHLLALVEVLANGRRCGISVFDPRAENEAAA